MKNIVIYIGAGLLIFGAVLGALTGLDAAVWIELAGAAAMLASCVKKVHDKAVKKDWKLYTALACIVIGTILMIWAGIAADLVTSVIAAVIGLVALVLSIIFINKNKNE